MAAALALLGNRKLKGLMIGIDNVLRKDYPYYSYSERRSGRGHIFENTLLNKLNQEARFTQSSYKISFENLWNVRIAASNALREIKVETTDAPHKDEFDLILLYKKPILN